MGRARAFLKAGCKRSLAADMSGPGKVYCSINKQHVIFSEMARRLFLPTIYLLALSLSSIQPGLAAAVPGSARFTVDAKVDQSFLAQLDVRLSCDSAAPAQQLATLDFDGTHEFTVTVLGAASASCTIVALLPAGQNVTYVGDGGSVIEFDEQGCHFSGVSAGHSNFCQVYVEPDTTRLTVYKKWIGGSGEERDVQIYLTCNHKSQGSPKWINSDLPQAWDLEVTDADGLRCSIGEEELDTFRADQSDCRNVLILPGADEACTLVNTKVVKRIETLNRYGLGVMILIMLTVGLLAIKRLLR